jgi:catechol 2,3-dioxygenase-like lactoylglutathione lyase family enzyme
MISGIDHINIRTRDLDRLCRFYVGVLGMEIGDRPPFPNPGVWLYAGGSPVVHVSVSDEPVVGDTQPFDHYALNAHGLADVRARLEQAGIDYSLVDVPGRAMKQVFVKDPDGLAVELNFTDPADVAGGG